MRYLPLLLVGAVASSAFAQMYPARQFRVGSGSNAAEYADLNGDGVLDLVSANWNFVRGSILLGLAEGCFAERVEIGLADNFADVVLGDVDGDGDVDVMLFSSNAPYELETWLNDGSAEFSLASALPLAFSHSDAVLADFDGDQLPDLVSLNSSTNTARLLSGDGLGGFVAGGAFPTGGATSIALGTGDFDEDGALDLALAAYSSHDVRVLFGNGAGGFGAPLVLTAAASPIDLEVVDWNADGHADILSASATQARVSALLGDGTGAFTRTDLDLNQDVESISVAYLNGDSHLDIAASGQADTTLAFGTGAGGLLATRSLPRIGGALAAFDADGDGRTDLAHCAEFLTVQLGDGSGRFGGRLAVTGGSNGSDTALAIADLDGDSFPDVVGTRRFGNGMTVWLGDGANGFSVSQTMFFGSSIGPVDVVVGDFDEDGTPDLATANEQSGNAGVLLGLGLGQFAVPTFHAAGTEPSALTAIDLDADGHLDLVLANRSSFDVSVLLGDGAGGFAAAQTYATTFGEPSDIAAGDVNGDGALDVLVTLETFQGKVAVLLNNGAGQLAPAATFPVAELTGSYPTALALGDLNEDGALDIATANEGGNGIGILLGDGAGEFGTPQLYWVEGTRPAGVQLADLDGDGHLDLIASTDDAGVSLRLGTGTGAFGLERTHALFVNEPKALGVADLDLDGNPEIVAALNGGGALEILPHAGGPPSCACGVDRFCGAAANSANFNGARLGMTGSLSLVANDFTLTVEDAVPGQFSICFYGSQRVFSPHGAGWRCIGPPFHRLLPAVQLDGAGAASYAVDFTLFPTGSGPGAILAGVPWGFQCWYRDPSGSATFNFSDGLQVVFCP